MKTQITTLALLFLFTSMGIYAHDAPRPRNIPSSCETTLCSATGVMRPQQRQYEQPKNENAAAFLSSIFDTSNWPPRWQCGIWSPFHGWLYILSDIIIWLSYFMIPAILGFFVYKKSPEPIPFRRVVFLFIAFILACGLTHLVDAVIFWWPVYKLSALVRFTTAIVSLGAVFALVKITPRVLDFKSPEVLEKIVNERTAELNSVNALLQEEVDSRLRAELELLHLNKQLLEKSERLERINQDLIESQAELKRRKEEVLALNAALEIKVHERTKELNAINQELEAFTYSVSHDLRAPLRSINGYTNILFEDFYDDLKDKAKRNLDVIRKNALTMGQLIDDLLEFSRTSRTKLEKEYYEPDMHVRNILDELLVNEKGRKINVAWLSPLENCHADASMLRQVWINLIGNALKYTRKNEAANIEIGSIRRESDVCYFVKDNGVGFDMTYVHKLFGVFQRLHTRQDFEGTGVGLALVKRIIEKHGGRIWAESEINKGAAFYFTLPL